MSDRPSKKPSIAIAYSIQRKNRKKLALGGAVEGPTHSEPKYTRNPGTPEKKPNDRRLEKDDYMSDQWAGGPDPIRKPDDHRRPKSAYIDTNNWSDTEKPSRKPFAEGGEVLTTKPNAGRPSQESTESTDLNARAYRQGFSDAQREALLQQEVAEARMFANGGRVEEEGRAQDSQNPGTPLRKPDDHRRPKDAYIDTDYWSDREEPSREPFTDGGVVDSIMRKRKMMDEGGSVSPTKTSTSSPTKTSTSTTGNKTKTGGSNPGGASTGGAGTVTISTGKMPPNGINISGVGGKTDAQNSGGMDPSDEDDEETMMANGGPVDRETLGTRIGYPGSPKPVKKAHGGSIQQAPEASESMVESIMRNRQAKRMADGGMVDLNENSEEVPARLMPYDDDNSDAANKEQYDLDQLDDQPLDSNQHGNEIESDVHDMISEIRRKMKSKRS